MYRNIIYFTSKTCAPCKQLLPRVKKLIEGREVGLTVIDIDEHPKLATDGGVMSVPTLLFPRRGEPTVSTTTDRLGPGQARIPAIRAKLEEGFDA